MTEQKARAVGTLIGQGLFWPRKYQLEMLEAISALLCPPVASPERWNATKAGATHTLPGGEDY
jgi:hypothetical protein